MEKLISTLVWAAIIQGIFLAGLYLFSKKHKSFANRLLGLFLLIIIYEGTLAFLPFNDIYGYSIYYFSLPEIKLFYPLLFFHYILEKVGRSRKYKNILHFHYIFAFAITGVSFINIFLYVFRGYKIEDYFGINTVESFFMAQQYYAFILIIIVFILALIEMKRYKMIVQKEYSDYEMLNINWLWRFIFSVFPIILLWGINLLWILMSGKNSFKFELVTWGFVIIFIYFVSFQAFKHKNLFENVTERLELPDKKGLRKEKRREEFLNPMVGQYEDEVLIQQIKLHMKTHQPYLDASLSMYQLAKQLKMPTNEVSQLINHKLNRHFFHFVNEYRIKRAMEILSNPQNNKMTILEILYEVGFNSKSSFNTAFKKYTGKTPTQYRKSISLSGH